MEVKKNKKLSLEEATMKALYDGLDNEVDDVEGLIDDVLVVTDPEITEQEYEEVIDRAQEIVEDTPEGEIPYDDEYLDEYLLTCPICGSTFVNDEILEPGATCPICLDIPEAFVVKGTIQQEEDVAAVYDLDDNNEEEEDVESVSQPTEEPEEPEEEEEPLLASEVTKTSDNKLEENTKLNETKEVKVEEDENENEVSTEVEQSVEQDSEDIEKEEESEEEDCKDEVMDIIDQVLNECEIDDKAKELLQQLKETADECEIEKEENDEEEEESKESDSEEVENQEDEMLNEVKSEVKNEEGVTVTEYTFEQGDVDFVKNLLGDSFTVTLKDDNATLDVEIVENELINGGIVNLTSKFATLLSEHIKEKQPKAEVTFLNRYTTAVLTQDIEQKQTESKEEEKEDTHKLTEGECITIESPISKYIDIKEDREQWDHPLEDEDEAMENNDYCVKSKSDKRIYEVTPEEWNYIASKLDNNGNEIEE